MRERLGGHYDRGELDAVIRIVMEEVLNYNPVDLVLWAERDVPEWFTVKLEDIVERLYCGEPIQYVLGVARFHGHNFVVTPSTLIPRPETEQLVDMILDREHGSDLRVLDVGTGSGCIAVSLALALRFAQVTAIDISADALTVARENARRLKAHVQCELADALTLRPRGEQWDVVVSNPPYVCESERAEMEHHVLDYEPASALFVPDADPLVYYKALARLAMEGLVRGGRIYLEINRRYGAEVAQLLRGTGMEDVEVHRDSYGNERFVTAVRQN